MSHINDTATEVAINSSIEILRAEGCQNVSASESTCPKSDGPCSVPGNPHSRMRECTWENTVETGRQESDDMTLLAPGGGGWGKCQSGLPCQR